jgi:hypothetical protein
VFFPILHFKRHDPTNKAHEPFTCADLFTPDYVLEQRSYVRLRCVRFPRIHSDPVQSMTQSNRFESWSIDGSCKSIDSVDTHSLTSLELESDSGHNTLLSIDRPTSVLSDESEDSGCVSMASNLSGNSGWTQQPPSDLGHSDVVPAALKRTDHRKDVGATLSSADRSNTSDRAELFADNIRFLEQFRKHVKHVEPRQRSYVPINKYLLKCTSKLLLDACSSSESAHRRSIRCHLIVGLSLQSDLFTATLLDNWFELTGARQIAAQTASRFGLRRISFLKRQSPQRATSGPLPYKLALFSHLDCSFDHLLHVVYSNVNERNVVLLQDFVYRFRSRYPSLSAHLYATEDT